MEKISGIEGDGHSLAYFYGIDPPHYPVPATLAYDPDGMWINGDPWGEYAPTSFDGPCPKCGMYHRLRCD